MLVRHFKAVRLLVSMITGLTAFGAPPGIAAANTVIDLTYDSVMDMVRPEVHPGIAVHHNLQITVSRRRSFRGPQPQRRPLPGSKCDGAGTEQLR